MWRVCELCVVTAMIAAAVGVETVWNEVDGGVGVVAGLAGGGTAAEDALTVLRSVPLRRLSAGDRRNVKRRILAVLGLDHAPRPRSVRGRRAAAVAAYMMALYRGGSDDDDDQGRPLTRNSAPPDDWTHSGLLSSDWLRLSSADTVISFANQGLYIALNHYQVPPRNS